MYHANCCSRGIAAAAALFTFAFVTPVSQAAVITADFEGAPGSVDHFPGAAGNGWTGPWEVINSNSTNITYAGAVANEMPLTASPNYLNASRTGGSGSGTAHVRRPFGAFGDVDPTQPHRITFNYRFDGTLTQFSGSFSDRINFFADPNAVQTTATSNAWMIGVAAASNGSTNVIPAANTFFFFDAGNESTANAFTGANLVNTGIALSPGTVYDFQVDVYPALGKYDATISNGSTSFTGTDLQFRSGVASSAAADAPDTLHFGIGASAAGDNHAFSLDGLTVSPIPEPGTVSLLAIGGMGLLARRRRRRSASTSTI